MHRAWQAVLAAALLMAGSTHAQTEMGQFENPGVPPDYIGMWTGEGSDGPLTGIVTEEGFKFVHSVGGGQLSIQIGNFSSWECAGPGAVRYDLDWTLVSPDGTSITERHCEYAEVDLQAGTFRWASGPANDCPQNATDSQVFGLEQLVNSTLATFPREQVC